MIRSGDDMFEPEEFIALYGDQAYHRAVEFVVIATQVGDTQGAEAAAQAAQKLAALGYHKNPPLSFADNSGEEE